MSPQDRTVLGQGAVCQWPLYGGWGGGDTAGGREGDGDGLKGSDHKEQEQSVFVAVCAASIRAITSPPL